MNDLFEEMLFTPLRLKKLNDYISSEIPDEEERYRILRTFEDSFITPCHEYRYALEKRLPVRDKCIWQENTTDQIQIGYKAKDNQHFREEFSYYEKCEFWEAIRKKKKEEKINVDKYLIENYPNYFYPIYKSKWKQTAEVFDFYVSRFRDKSLELKYVFAQFGPNTLLDWLYFDLDKKLKDAIPFLKHIIEICGGKCIITTSPGGHFYVWIKLLHPKTVKELFNLKAHIESEFVKTEYNGDRTYRNIRLLCQEKVVPVDHETFEPLFQVTNKKQNKEFIAHSLKLWHDLEPWDNSHWNNIELKPEKTSKKIRPSTPVSIKNQTQVKYEGSTPSGHEIQHVHDTRVRMGRAIAHTLRETGGKEDYNRTLDIYKEISVPIGSTTHLEKMDKYDKLYNKMFSFVSSSYNPIFGKRKPKKEDIARFSSTKELIKFYGVNRIAYLLSQQLKNTNFNEHFLKTKLAEFIDYAMKTEGRIACEKGTYKIFGKRNWLTIQKSLINLGFILDSKKAQDDSNYSPEENRCLQWLFHVKNMEQLLSPIKKTNTDIKKRIPPLLHDNNIYRISVVAHTPPIRKESSYQNWELVDELNTENTPKKVFSGFSNNLLDLDEI